MIPSDRIYAEELVAVARSLFERGYSFGTAGNISVRVGASILVTSTGSSLRNLSADALARVGVIAILPTTLNPTVRLIEAEARSGNMAIETRRYPVEGAFDVLMSGDGRKHDEMILAEIVRAASENDVVVLAQGSMALLVPALGGKTRVPLLSSPRLGVEALREALET